MIVCISIPLSILVSLIVLSLLGQTINVMTLGGMALAVGILVDDATVEIENTHRNMAMKKPLVRAVLDGAQQIAAPAFVSTLCHLHRVRSRAAADRRGEVSVHAAGHGGGVRHDGVVPALAHPGPHHGALHAAAGSEALRAGRARRDGGRQGHHLEGALHLQPALRADARLPTRRCSHWSLDHRGPVLAGFGIFVAGSLCLAMFIGRDFFPTVDSGQMRLHARAPAGTRIEQTEVVFAEIEARDPRRHSRRAKSTPSSTTSAFPTAASTWPSATAPPSGSGDGDILISLDPENHGPTAEYTDRLRKRLHEKFPDVTVFFEAANITNQILNFGLPAPIDVQVVGRNATANYQIAEQLQPADRAHSRRGRRAHPPGGGLPRDRHQRGPHQGRHGGAHAKGRRQQHADFALGQRPGGSYAVARLEQRRQLLRWPCRRRNTAWTRWPD